MSIYATLNLTAKSHKSPVEFRNIHSAPRWSSKSLAGFVVKSLDQVLLNYDHVLNDTAHFVGKIKTIMPQQSHLFCKIDVKHFFMSGSSYELASLCASLFTQDKVLHDLMYDAIFLLLDSQYIRIGGIWPECKVVVGSGMGLTHSGSVADAAFLAATELAILPKLREFQIDLYARFKDDVFILARSMPDLKIFFEQLKENAKPFSISCEEISRIKVVFLEVSVQKQCEAFHIKPCPKQTRLGVPWLAKSSCHHQAVHKAWPQSVLKRKLNLCNPVSVKLQVWQDFFAKAQLSNLHPCAIEEIRKIKPVFFSKASRTSGRPARRDFPKSNVIHELTSSDPSRTLWLILPYHPSLERVRMQRWFNNFLQSSFARTLLGASFEGLNPHIRMGWRNAMPNLVQRSKRF